MSSPEVDLVFADLAETYTALESAKSSPKEVRQIFSRFVELSQRLTSAMRIDFKALTGQAWEAKNFEGWDAVSSLFKILRNNDQHELQTHISVKETGYFKIPGHADHLLAISGTWETIDQLLSAPPDGLCLRSADPETGQITDEKLYKARVEYQFLIRARENRTQVGLEAIGSNDVHELSSRCMITLTNYYKFYLQSLRAKSE